MMGLFGVSVPENLNPIARCEREPESKHPRTPTWDSVYLQLSRNTSQVEPKRVPGKSLGFRV